MFAQRSREVIEFFKTSFEQLLDPEKARRVMQKLSNFERAIYDDSRASVLGLEALDTEFEAARFSEPEWEHGETSTSSCPAFTPAAVENPGGGRVKDKRIPSKSDLVTVPGAFGAKVPLHRLAAAAHKALVCAARAGGIKSPLLLPTGSRSGFRDPKQQMEAWKRAVAKYGSEKAANKWVARPGSSAHQTGRAIDFYMGLSNSSSNVDQLRKTRAYNWMVTNAQRFGFYPYKTEPWHWEYNPPAARASEVELHEFFTPYAHGGRFPGRFRYGQGLGHRRRHPRMGFGWTGEMETEGELTSTTITYSVDASQPFGPKWKSTRPPGLPASARQASTRGAALPYIEKIATPLFLGDVFIKTLKHLSQTESGGRFGLPANIFDARSKEQRPAGKALITAWGAFQFNRDAWRALSGVSPATFPWDATPYEELFRPIARYAQLFFEVLRAGGSHVDAARGIRLWHRTPAGYRQYVNNGRRSNFTSAWSLVPAQHRTITDKHLRETGVLT